LPDITGSITAFLAVFLLIRVWRPREMLGFGGVPIQEGAPAGAVAAGSGPSRPAGTGRTSTLGNALYGLIPIMRL
jgi:hypothetical protein